MQTDPIKRIGGSDIAAICGLSPWKTAYQVWLEKTGNGEPVEQTPAMSYGLLVEPVIRQWYANETGQIVHMDNCFIVHPYYDFLAASLDGRTDDRVIEIKTARSSHDWGEPGTDEIPVYYRTQVEWYMWISGLHLADVVVSFAGSMPVIYECEEDMEIQDLLLERALDFWDRVQNNNPPDASAYSDIQLKFGRSSGKGSITATADVQNMVAELAEVRLIIKSREGDEERLIAAIMQAMGEHDTLLGIDGQPLATWKMARSSKRFDSKRFQTENKELYNQYLTESPGLRRFLLKYKENGG